MHGQQNIKDASIYANWFKVKELSVSPTECQVVLIVNDDNFPECPVAK
jgi:hypothetical protein